MSRRLLTTAATALLTLATTGFAQEQTWGLIAEDSNAMVATITFSGDAPYTHNDVVEIALTDDGAAIYNVPSGPLAFPMVRTSNGSVGIDSEGRLTNDPSNGLVFMTQSNPADFVGGGQPDSFSINFYISANSRSQLYLSVDYNGPGTTGVYGTWQPLVDCEGDVDGDSDVDLSDLATLLSEFGQTGTGFAGDVNGDGMVDLSDLALVLGRFGASC